MIGKGYKEIWVTRNPLFDLVHDISLNCTVTMYDMCLYPCVNYISIESFKKLVESKGMVNPGYYGMASTLT